MRYDVSNSECGFFDDIVPYMYGDLAPGEASSFESHLSNCARCTDEFAEVANARYEVYDWKRTEFEPLATPVFEIPYEKPARATFVDSIRTAFSRGWAVPSLGFAAVVIAVALAGGYYLSGEGSSDVAVVNPSVERTVPVSTAAPATAEPVTVTSEDKGEKVIRPVRAATAVRRMVRTKPQKATTRPVVSKDATQARNVTVPTLNEFADEEDNSLRLAQLFEDLDTRD